MSEIDPQKRKEEFTITIILMVVITVVLALSGLQKKTAENNTINQLRHTRDSLIEALNKEKENAIYWKRIAKEYYYQQNN